MIKAVLFDLGGTLMHYHGADEKTLFMHGAKRLHEELVSRGYAVPDFEPFHHRIYRAIRVKVALLFFSERELKVDVLLTRILKRMKVELKPGEIEELAHAWWDAYEKHVGFYNDVAETLKKLRGMGLKIGLISNTIWPAYVLKAELARREHAQYFDLMLFSPEVGYRKPSRKIFKQALGELGIRGSEAAFVGDRLVEDIRGPQRMKMLAILKRHPKQKPRQTIQPDYVIDELSEIPAIIEEVNKD